MALQRVRTGLSTVFSNSKIAVKYPSLGALESTLLQTAVGGPKSLFFSGSFWMPTLESLQFWAQHPQWVFDPDLLLREKLCFHRSESWRGSPALPVTVISGLKLRTLHFPSLLELCGLFSRKDSIYWRASGKESVSWGRFYRFGSLLAPLSHSSGDREPGGGDVDPGRCPGCPGSESEHGHHQHQGPGAVTSCLQNIYSCTD